jgi:hypothetical protein
MPKTWAAIDPDDGSVLVRFVNDADMLAAAADPDYEGCRFAFIPDPADDQQQAWSLTVDLTVAAPLSWEAETRLIRAIQALPEVKEVYLHRLT